MRPFRLALVLSALLAMLYVAELVYAFRTIPDRNTARVRFDTLLVLGNPDEDDGTPSREQRERVLEAVREWKKGVAPRMIMTGGAVMNEFQEGHAMAQQAIALGVPAEAVVEEDEARNTIQNIFYSYRIMEAHGWRSAEVISSPSHLPRAALILEHYCGPLAFEWRTHAAHWPPRYVHHEVIRYYFEANACLLFRALGFRPTPFLPGGR